MSEGLRRLKMFPLGSVLFPLGILPLHVFEPRYLQMVAEAIADDGEFGVVLIERGSEVGGGDERFSLGTIAKIVRAEVIGENRLGVIAVGGERFRVDRWLPDDPYPAALVTMLADEPASPELAPLLDEAVRLRRRVLGLAAELGTDVGDTDFELPDDPTVAAWFACAAAPISQLDRQRILECPGPVERLGRLNEALAAQAELLEGQLATG